MLGYGVKKLYDEGRTGCMVTASPSGKISPLYLEDVEDEHGKIKPRLVNMSGAKAKLIFEHLVNMSGAKAKLIFEHGLQFIEPGDYEEAKEWLDDPKQYDFREILKW